MLRVLSRCGWSAPAKSDPAHDLNFAEPQDERPRHEVHLLQAGAQCIPMLQRSAQRWECTWTSPPTPLQGLDNTVMVRLGSLLKRVAPHWPFSGLARAVVARMLARQERYTCSLMTVSDIMSSEVMASLPLACECMQVILPKCPVHHMPVCRELEAIDLLKVDAGAGGAGCAAGREGGGLAADQAACG